MADKRTTIKDSKNVIAGDTRIGGNAHIGDLNTNSGNKYFIFNLSIGQFTFLSISLASVTILIVLGLIPLPDFRKNIQQKDPAAPIEEVDTTAKNENISPGTPSNPASKDRKIITKPDLAEPKHDALAGFVNIGQHIDIALYQSDNLNLSSLRTALQEQFKSTGLSVSGSFFRPAFSTKFGSKVTNIDFAALNSMNLQKQVNCICQITEDISYTNNEIEGSTFITAGGSVKVIIYNVATGGIDISDVGQNIKGAGVSREAALASFEEKILQSSKFHNGLNLTQCKGR